MQTNRNDPKCAERDGNSGTNQFIIEPMLSYGRENAVSTKELMTALNMTERELRARVAYERNHGAIICSSTTGGYFKFKSREELKEFYKGLERKATSIFQALRSARKALEEAEGQLTLDGRESGD